MTLDRKSALAGEKAGRQGLAVDPWFFFCSVYGDVVVIAAVDRLSRDTTDLMVIARDLQKAGAGLRSLAEPVVDTTSDFAELVLAMLGVAAKLERRRIKERLAPEFHAIGFRIGAASRRALDRAQLQCQRRDDFGAGVKDRSVILIHKVSQLAIAERAAGLIVTFGFIVRVSE